MNVVCTPNFMNGVYKPKILAALVFFALCSNLIDAVAAVSLQAGVESGVSVSDNIGQDSKGSESSDVVVQVKPTLSLKSKSRRSTVSLDYALQDLNYARNTDANAIYHQLNAVGQATFVPKMFSLQTDITRTQYASTPQTSSNFNNFGITNRYNVTRARISPSLQLHYLDAAQAQVNYTAGHVSLDHIASTSDVRQLDAKANSGKAFNRLRWQTSYSQVEEIRRDTIQSNIKFTEAKASAEYGIFRSLYVKSEFGRFESENVNSRFFSENGNYQSYGLRFRPTRRLDVAAIGGPDYQSATIDLQPTPRTKLNGSWHRSVFGQLYGNNSVVAASLKLRKVRWRLSYSDSVTSIQQLILNQPVENANLQTFQLTDSIFRQKQASLSVNRQGKRVQIDARFFIDKRDYELNQGNAPVKVAGIASSVTIALDGRLNVIASTHNEFRSALNNVDAGSLDSFSLGLALKKRRNISASLSYRYTSQSDPLVGTGGYSYVENSILALASFSH